MATSNSGGGGFAFALFVIFLALKLTGTVTWSWWIITMPLWLGLAIWIVLGGAVLIFMGFMSVVMSILYRDSK